MSIYFNQTNISPATSQFITRQEVIQGFSTLAGDLSGVNLSSFFISPNPLFSTINMNPAGLIGGYANAQLNKVNLSTQQALGLTNLANYPGAITALIDGGSNTAPVVGIGFKAQLLQNTNAQTRIDYNFNQMTGTQDGLNFSPLAVYNPALSPPWNLTNVSTINGIPPNTSGTTFTNLTGSNITMSGTLACASFVNVSSINGELYTPSQNILFTGSNNVAVGGAGLAVNALSIAVPAGFLIPNQAYLYDIPFNLGAFPPSPTGFTLLIGARVGGQGQINYSLPLVVSPTSQNISLNLTGIANTGTTVGTNTVDIIMRQTSGSSFTLPVFAPTPGPGNPNTLTLKAI